MLSLIKKEKMTKDYVWDSEIQPQVHIFNQIQHSVLKNQLRLIYIKKKNNTKKAVLQLHSASFSVMGSYMCTPIFCVTTPPVLNKHWNEHWDVHRGYQQYWLTHAASNHVPANAKSEVINHVTDKPTYDWDDKVTSVLREWTSLTR